MGPGRLCTKSPAGSRGDHDRNTRRSPNSRRTTGSPAKATPTLGPRSSPDTRTPQAFFCPTTATWPPRNRSPPTGNLEQAPSPRSLKRHGSRLARDRVDANRTPAFRRFPRPVLQRFPVGRSRRRGARRRIPRPAQTGSRRSVSKAVAPSSAIITIRPRALPAGPSGASRPPQGM